MARTIRDEKLDTRAARDRLSPSRKPYFKTLEPGKLHLGYRRKRKDLPGQWIVRHYVGGERYHVAPLGLADDFQDVADGAGVLNFAEAQRRALAHKGAGGETTPRGGLSVANAMDDYMAFLESKRRTAKDARYRDQAFIRSKLGNMKVESLTTDRLRRWLDEVAEAPPRLRTKKGQKQRFRETADDDESPRRRQSTANRTWTVFKAALNMAWRAGKVSDDLAWRKVKPFEGVDFARVRYLQVAEAKRLLNACAPDFRRLVQAALLTGGRYGQLGALVAGDFNRDSGTVTMQSRKGGRGKLHVYHCVLTQEGRDFFTRATAGIASGDIIFKKSNGERWEKSNQKREMEDACKAAKIAPPISFHGIRHTWASLAIMNGVPLVVVAENLGHADTRMVSKHYGHLAPSYKADAIRAGAPVFGIKPDKKLVTLPR